MRPQKTTPLSGLLLLVLLTLLLPGCGPGEKPAASASVGQAAPTFTLTDIQGKAWSLADLRGKVVFLNFWATWCPPCLQEMPSMMALNQQMAGQPFQMVTVLFNDRPEYAWNLVRKTGLSLPVLVDGDGTVSSRYGLTGVPETFIIDPQGVLRQKFIGPLEWDSPAAMGLLRQYLPASVSQAPPAPPAPPALAASDR